MKNNWEKVDLIGILATEEEISKAYNKENIFINSNDFIQFYIKLISTKISLDSLGFIINLKQKIKKPKAQN